MTEIGLLIIGAAIGGMVAWFIATSHQQKKNASQVTEVDRRASSAEAILAERGQQIQKRDAEIERLRTELDAEKGSRVEAVTRLEESQKNLEEQKNLLETMKTEMKHTFDALSKTALESNNETFLLLANQKLEGIIVQTEGKLGKHQTAMDGMITPLRDMLGKYEQQIREIEESRHKAYGSLTEQLRALASTHENLQRETSNLVSALRKPQVRGRWGEMQLRRVAELSGMSMHCDFSEQQSVDTEKGRIRPDMVVHLPMDREIVVDSKVSLEAYLDAISAPTEDERKTKMEKHAQQVRTHMSKLASKEYWAQFNQSPEFVVLFIPGESFLSSALETDTTLIEDGIQKRVIIATPTTFIALLRAIAYGWRQEQVTKNAQEISALGKELYERMRTLSKYFDELGTAVGRSMDAYNRIVGSMEARVLPSMRRFKELGVTGAEEIPVLEQIDQKPRSLNLLPEESRDAQNKS